MNEFQGSTAIHICGHTRDRWDLVVGSGVSGFWVDNLEDIGELKDLYGQQVSRLIARARPPAFPVSQWRWAGARESR